MSEHAPEPDPLDDELDQLSSQMLFVEATDPQTGERHVEGVISREQLARAIIERDEL